MGRMAKSRTVSPHPETVFRPALRGPRTRCAGFSLCSPRNPGIDAEICEDLVNAPHSCSGGAVPGPGSRHFGTAQGEKIFQKIACGSEI
jgi:hypothetical protein